MGVSVLDVCSDETPETPPSGAQTLETVLTQTEAEGERAVVVEHDRNIPRAWAEGFARLDPDRPAGDVPRRQWLAFVNDVGRFLDSPFCAVAAAEGWSPYELFGCHGDRPYARIDCAGLLWLLDGSKLVELTATTAAIERPTGTRQTWRRKPVKPSCMLPWEIRVSGAADSRRRTISKRGPSSTGESTMTLANAMQEVKPEAFEYRKS